MRRFVVVGLTWFVLSLSVRAQEREVSSLPTATGKEPTVRLSPEHFEKLRALIKPKPGGFDDLPWLTDLWEARRKGAAEGKPLLVWVGDGHPLGWT